MITLQQAAEYAAWWTRYSLDLAAGAPDLHPGVRSHLTAAQSQHWAVDKLLKTSEREAA